MYHTCDNPNLSGPLLEYSWMLFDFELNEDDTAS